MRRFARLFAELDQTNKTNDKLAAMAAYFRSCDPASAAWALYFLSGQKLKRLVPTAWLRAWAIEVANIEEWLFDECYETVGDLGETISLVVPRPIAIDQELSLAVWVEERLLPLRQLTLHEQQSAIVSAWRSLDQVACLVFNKLITGSFRVGVSHKLVVRALAAASGVDAEVLAHRLMGTWQPTAEFYNQLVQQDAEDAQVSRPYPFFLAHPLEQSPEELGESDQWQAEWKWDGIRAQVVRRQRQTFIWSRGEELMTERFPELEQTAVNLRDGTVLDGEIVGFLDGSILPFAHLQRRIGRKQLGKKILSEVPVAFLAFDLLELDGVDMRAAPLVARRAALEQVIDQLQQQHQPEHVEAVGSQGRQRTLELVIERMDQETREQVPRGSTHGADRAGGTGRAGGSGVPGDVEVGAAQSCSFQLPPAIRAASWEELSELRQTSRAHRAEGLMLKRLDSPYRVGRPRGDWWKWKIEPYTIDAVLIYAQRGHGRRASLYTDYTFAVWDADTLVPFAKAYSGLTDKEIQQVDSFVRRNTLERFGPVRSVKPELVFELAFENIQLSTRHKSGVAVRFPRILRWRHDKTIADADSLETIRAMLRGPDHR